METRILILKLQAVDLKWCTNIIRKIEENLKCYEKIKIELTIKVNEWDENCRIKCNHFYHRKWLFQKY